MGVRKNRLGNRVVTAIDAIAPTSNHALAFDGTLSVVRG